jgi:sortase A
MSFFLLFGGLILFGYAGYHLFSQKIKEDKALEEAKEVVNTFKINDTTTNSVFYRYTQGDVVGILNIPKLNKKLPIIEGTEEAELEKGVGHYSDTKLPGQKDRIFLAGHRDTVFKRMGEIEIGDTLSIQMESGTYQYKVFETIIVKESDLSVLQPTSPDEVLTLSTCYPFEYLSSTEERYIINARRMN